MLIRRVLIALTAIFALAQVTKGSDFVLCARQDLPAKARCGTVTVPLSYDRPDDGSLNLEVIVLPARGETVASEPVFYLVGGPGTGATESTSFFSDSMMKLQKTHEIVLFDLRGTGESEDFQCKLSAAEKRDVLLAFRASEGLKRCARDLKSRETLRTTVFAHDIERVRQAIGAEKINLMGVSYGTRLALEYARLYPKHLRASVLRGVSSPAANTLAQIMDGSQHELTALAASNPGLAESYAQLMQQLETKPVTVRAGSSNVAGDDVSVDHLTFAALARFLLYDPRTAQSLPAIVAATAAGELAPLGQVISGVDKTISRFSIPVLLGVLCAEDVPFWELDDNGGSFAPALVRNNAIAACRTWSVPPVDVAFRKPVASIVPTLLLSGAHDPATPANIAEAVSKSLPNSLHLVAPDIGHFPTWTNCYASLVASFFDGGSVGNLDVSCVAKP